MALNKFEKHIKEELKQREIHPSADAWQRLSKQLDEVPVSEEKSFSWYAVAACVVGLLVASVWYFNADEKSESPAIEVVDVEKVDANVDTLQGRKQLVQPKAAIELAVDVLKNEAARELEMKKPTKNEVPELQSEIALSEAFEVERNTKQKEVLVANTLKEEVINTKILEIVAVVDSLEKNNTQITEAEVDRLLRQAQQEILKEKLFANKDSLGAMALLNEVENELDKSFRAQIFESLKEGFLKVRTAVADRNN